MSNQPRPVSVTLRPGIRVRVADNDHIYRGWTGTIVSQDARRVVGLGEYNRRLLREGAVLVEMSSGKLFVVFPHVLEIA